MRRRYLRIVLAVLIAALALLWWRYAPARDGVYVVAAGDLTWTLTISSGVLQTTALDHRPSRTQVPVAGDDFVLRVGSAQSIGWRALADPPRPDAAEFCVRDGVVFTPRECVARWVVRGLHSTTFILEPRQGGFRIALRFGADKQTGTIRRSLSLVATDAKTHAVDMADHVRWRLPAAVTGGGRGQPLWLADTFFCGLEHPFNDAFAVNNLVVLRQYPGTKFDATPLTLQLMILGAGAPGRVTEAFTRYLDTVRRPPRARTLYNTWCDLREDQLTLGAVTNQAAAWRALCTRYNIPLDLIVLDDGWQDKDSIWFARQDRFPGGLAPLGAALRALRFQAGLWLPFSGTMLNTAWGGARGYEVACPRYYCMSGTNYNAALRDSLLAAVNDMQLSFFKHDFNYFVCGQPEHGHFPSELQSSEANVNALLDLLRMETRLRPDIFLAVTSGLWPSPWWLLHCDTIWMGGKDHDFDTRLPASRGSAFEMNYRDGALYQLLVTESNTFPLSALMTHGVVDARHTVYDVAAEDDEGWANYLMNYLGRGTLMRELYITPEKLTATRWNILGHAVRWAQSLDACMAHSAFALGDPRTGGLVAFAGDDGTRAYASVRNPGLSTQRVRADQLGLTNDICEVVYPWREALRNRPDLSFDIPPEAVVQLESYPRSAIAGPLVLGTRALVVTGTADTTELRIAVDGPPREVTLAAAPGQTIKAVAAQGATVLRGNDDIWRVRVGHSTSQAGAHVRRAVMAPGPAFTADIAVPRQIRAQLQCVLRAPQALTPAFSINGTPTIAAWTSGDGWQLATLRLQPGDNLVQVAFQKDTLPSDATLQVFLLTQMARDCATLTITHSRARTVAAPPRPVPLLQDIQPDAAEVLAPLNLLAHAERPVDTRRLTLVQNALAGARRAELLIDTFDVNGGDYADKQLYLNDFFIGLLPTNAPPLANWTNHVLRLPEGCLPRLTADNALTLRDATGDSYKIRPRQLRVVLRDKSLITTPAQTNVYSTSMSWKYAEGVQLPPAGKPVLEFSF
jgi:hypothetical protein